MDPPPMSGQPTRISEALSCVEPLNLLGDGPLTTRRVACRLVVVFLFLQGALVQTLLVFGRGRRFLQGWHFAFRMFVIHGFFSRW
jgi:hypothetical protein